MKNVHLIYDYVEPIKVNYFKKPIKIRIKQENFNSDSLKYLAGKFKYLYTYRLLKWTILIIIESSNFSDKITYLILDALLYDFLKNTNFEICVNFNSIDRTKISNIGFISTALCRAIDKYGRISKKDFINFYEKQYYANKYVYRRLITYQMLKRDNEWPSKIYMEVTYILKTYSKENDWNEGIAEVISELVCNVSSHTDGDCLIDINISDKMQSKKDCNNDNSYLGVNIAVINFSQNRLFDYIKKDLKDKKYKIEDPVYNKIYKAYDVHKRLFDDKYKEDDFFLITAFQNRVSSRSFSSESGGTGLTTLIEEIIDKTEDDYSYVLSGNNILFFKPKYLVLSDDKYIGFNKQHDYFNFRPSKDVIGKTNIYIPGSAYHLLLIKKE